MHRLHLHIMYVSTSKEIRKNRVNKAQDQRIDRFHGTLNTSIYKYHVCSTSCHKCMLKNLNRAFDLTSNVNICFNLQTSQNSYTNFP